MPAFSQNQYGVYGDGHCTGRGSRKASPFLILDRSGRDLDAIPDGLWRLIEIARLGAGDTVLIPAASSSVGIAAIQIASMVGATPIALTRKHDKRTALTKLGAAHVIATQEQDVVAEVDKLTEGQGAEWYSTPSAAPMSPS